MKTIILITAITVLLFSKVNAAIQVQANGKHITLTSADIKYLQTNGSTSVKQALVSYGNNGTIRNNVIADQILILLKK